MLGLSANAITAINQNARTHIKIQFADSATVFDDSDVAFSGGFELDAPLNPDADLTMGRAVSSQVKVVFLNSANVALIDWTKAMTVSLGVEVGNDVEYCQLGVFTGEKPEKTQLVDKVTFTAYDNMCKFDVEAYPLLSGLNWAGGITVSSILSSVCSYVGVPLATLNSNYIMSNIMGRTYTTNPFTNNGFTCREIIAFIAEANCCYARINPAGELDLVWFDDSMYDTETITRNNWFSADVSEHNATISALKVYMTEDDVGVVMPSGTTDLTGNLYRIFDNPLLGTGDSADETAYITPIYNRLVNFGTYVPVSVSADGHWYLEAGDIIKVESQSGTYIRMPVFNKRLNWNGTASEYYETTGSTKREPITQTNRKNMTYNGRLHEIKVTIDKNYELIQDQFGNYYTKSETATQITTQVSSAMGNYYTKTETDSQISTQMGTALGNYYTKTETASQISTSISNSLGNYYTKTETASQISTSISNSLGNYYTKTETATQISTSISNSLGNYYTKTETSSLVSTTISNSLGNYSTTSQMNSAISSAVGNCYGKVTYVTIDNNGLTVTDANGSNAAHCRLNSSGISYAKNGTNARTFHISPGTGSTMTIWATNTLYFMTNTNTVNTSGIKFERRTRSADGYEFLIINSDAYGSSDPYRLSVGFQDTWSATNEFIDQVCAYNVHYVYLTSHSSRAIKHNIQYIEEAGNIIDGLKPCTFVYDFDTNEKNVSGFIYEDAVNVLPEMCFNTGGVPSIAPQNVIPYLVKEVQSLRQRVRQLENGGN